jgi:hypothetical protein
MDNSTSNGAIRNDRFNRAIGALVGIPDVISCKPTTIRATVPLAGEAQTFIIQTFRQRQAGATPEEPGTTDETVFLEYVDEAGSIRIVIPPPVVRAILRQHDSLAARARSKAAKTVAEERAAMGIKPGFMKSRK